MENSLGKLLTLSQDEQVRLGVLYTPKEIAGQVGLWSDTCARVLDQGPALASIVEDIIRETVRHGEPSASDLRRSRPRVILTGAGSSDFVGKSLVGLMQRQLGVDVQSCATTDILTNPADFFSRDSRYLVISFARSGDSPESTAVFDLAWQLAGDVRQIAITCNGEGLLARRVREAGERALAIILNEATNDRGLAMTSSFTNMVVAGQSLAFYREPQIYLGFLDEMVQCGENLLQNYPDLIRDIATRDFERAMFLGDGALGGVSREAALKLLELTDGAVMTRWDSFLGVRHGPASAINDKTLVVYFVSVDPYVQKYEFDLMREIKERKTGALTVALCYRQTRDIEGLCDVVIELHPEVSPTESPLPDTLRPPVDVIFGQLLGLFKSLALGYRPDAPSARGIINRVVQGVKVYPYTFS